MKKLLVLLLSFFVLSCGEREDREKPPKGLEGRWQSYEVRCYREIVFLKDQFFQEVAKCRDKSKSHTSTGIWSRSQDNVISMKYVESTDLHRENVEIHAVVDLDEDRILITNLKETVVFRRVSNHAEYRFPQPTVPSVNPKPDCPDIIINNSNNNNNGNTNTNDVCKEG